ncbi:hypothetical protein ACFLZ2_03860 [Candidatus Margulisiibacteriota bacterium]
MSKKIILLILIVCFASLTALAFQPQGGAAWKPPKAFKHKPTSWEPPKGVPTTPKTWGPPKAFKHKPASWEPPKSFKKPPSEPWQPPKRPAPDIIPTKPSAPAPSPGIDSTIPTRTDQPVQPDSTQPGTIVPVKPTAPPPEPIREPKERTPYPEKTRQTYPNKLERPIMPPPPTMKYTNPTRPPSNTIYPGTDYYKKY